MQDSLGESSINGGRRRKEEFNPFAKDASAQHRRRKDERERRESRRPAPPVDTPTQRPDDVKAELERKQREAIEKLEQQGDVSAPVVAPAPVPVHHEGPKIDDSQSVAPVSREDRIAELRRKSEALKKNAPSAAATASTEVAPRDVEVVVKPQTVTQEPDDDEDEDQDETPQLKSNKKVKNVFKKIETKIEPPQDRRRGKRRMDKKGGGRQKQVKKLDRQKYLEYKYVAKDLLNDPNVPEEQRSNVLGQVWAKGERSGIEESLAYIEQKEEELVLPTSVADELRKLVKDMTTRR